MDLQDLPYRAKWFPAAPIFAMLLIAVIILGQEFSDIISGDITWQKFLATYIGFMLFLALLIGYKLIKRSKLIALEKCDISAKH